MQLEEHIDQYKIHHLLGQGGQAAVYLASKESQLLAIKVYQPHHGCLSLKAYNTEVNLLSHLHHDNIVNLIDHRPNATIFLHKKVPEQRPIVVLQLAENGDLFDILKKTGGFPEDVCRAYAKQLIRALKYLNQAGVAHRDLKTQNILFDSNYTLKVSDFGLARNAEGDHGNFKLTSQVGTTGFKPPEMMTGKYIGIHVDIFAAGVVIFIMFAGCVPFFNTSNSDSLYKMIKETKYQKFWNIHSNKKKEGFYSMPFKRLMNAFFSADPERRPTFADLESNQWLNDKTATTEQLKQFMKERFDSIDSQKNKRKKLAAIKLDLFKQHTIQAEEDQMIHQGQRCEEVPAKQVFARNYKILKNVKLQDLEIYNKEGVVYIPQSPAFLMAWLHDYLDTKFKEKYSFLDNFPQSIEPTDFKMSYEQDKRQLQIQLSFSVGEDEQIELKLNGQLCRSQDGKVGIDWVKIEGNEYWLESVQKSLNDEAKLLQ